MRRALLYLCMVILYAGLYAQVIKSSLSGNILSLVSGTTKITLESDLKLPPDITFFFADIKYTGHQFKICEFGEMYLEGAWHHLMVNGKKELVRAPYWDLFWHYLALFNKPIWYVGKQRASLFKELGPVGGKTFATMQEFLTYYSGQSGSKYEKIDDYQGILILYNQMDYKQREQFLRTHPEILVVNAHTKKFTGKHNLFDLFNKHKELHDLIPQWKVYQKEYTPELATRIAHEISADFYIIKPMRGVSSKGVLMVEKKDLDSTLKSILLDKEKIKKTGHMNLLYWKTDAHENFFVQAYAPSKEITIKDKKYDPTMHVVFFLAHDQGVMSMNVVAGHWKIPPKALNESGELTEKHITQPLLDNSYLESLVDPYELSKNLKQITKLMENILPFMYVKMLEDWCKSTR